MISVNPEFRGRLTRTVSDDIVSLALASLMTVGGYLYWDNYYRDKVFAPQVGKTIAQQYSAGR